jgi:hypothetical protein
MLGHAISADSASENWAGLQNVYQTKDVLSFRQIVDAGYIVTFSKQLVTLENVEGWVFIVEKVDHRFFIKLVHQVMNFPIQCAKC